MRKKQAKKLRKLAVALTMGNPQDTRKVYQNMKAVHKSLNKNQR